MLLAVILRSGALSSEKVGQLLGLVTKCIIRYFAPPLLSCSTKQLGAPFSLAQLDLGGCAGVEQKQEPHARGSVCVKAAPFSPASTAL